MSLNLVLLIQNPHISAGIAIQNKSVFNKLQNFNLLVGIYSILIATGLIYQSICASIWPIKHRDTLCPCPWMKYFQRYPFIYEKNCTLQSILAVCWTCEPFQVKIMACFLRVFTWDIKKKYLYTGLHILYDEAMKA